MSSPKTEIQDFTPVDFILSILNYFAHLPDEFDCETKNKHM